MSVLLDARGAKGVVRTAKTLVQTAVPAPMSSSRTYSASIMSGTRACVHCATCPRIVASILTPAVGVQLARSHGAETAVMDAKLADIDALINATVANLEPDTLLVVLGDHGMTSTGNHGGSTQPEVDAALFVLSTATKPLVADSADATCARAATAAVKQVDIVPTLAVLMGVPIPYANVGAPITAFR